MKNSQTFLGVIYFLKSLVSFPSFENYAPRIYLFLRFNLFDNII